MQFDSIADVYAANDHVRNSFRNILADISDNEAAASEKDSSWTIAEIAEHVALVNGGMAKICSRLLSKAQADGLTANGEITLSDAFMNKSAEIAGIKVEAPEMVHPSGSRTVADSLAIIDEVAGSLDELRPLFESVDSVTHKFPHPFFGDLSASEWLVLLGGHQARHAAQIQRILEQARG